MKLAHIYILLMASYSLNIQAGGDIDFTPHGTQPGLNFALEPPTSCSSCHKGGSLVDDKINMPTKTWAGSMKANATRDPLFWAALDVANNDIPGVGDFCLKCHTPQGWFMGHVVKPTDDSMPLVDGANGCELSGDHVSGDGKLDDYNGVNCHFCHRMEEKGPNGENQILENGDAWVDDQTCDNGGFGPCRKGPYKYPDFNTPPHAWKYSNFIQDSKVCGTCHDISSPTIEQNGVFSIAKKFWHEGVETNIAMPVERTYSEWKNSYFADLIFRDGLNEFSSNELPALAQGETCQGCHMPLSESDEARACTFDELDQDGNGRRKGELRTHQFAGANTWMPQVMKAIYGDDLEANDTSSGRKESFDLTTSYAFNMLQNNSANIQVDLVNQTTDFLDVEIEVTNLTGHKLPTGYPEGRRMWIAVEVKDGANQVIWESGAYDVSTGVLTEDSQVKIYESLQGIWNPMANGGTGECEVEDGNGDKMFHFVLNNCIAKDNRIPPLGFRGAANIEMKPVGITYPAHPTNPGQVVNFDVTPYQVPVTGLTGPFSVEATLKYQVASDEYIEFLEQEAIDNTFETENQMCDRSWTVGPSNQTRGAFMQDLWETYGRSEPVDMVMDFLVVN